MAKPKRGEVKALRAAEARRERKTFRAVDPEVPVAVRETVSLREHGLCLVCNEADPDLRVYSFRPGEALDDPENHALLCRFCRGNAALMRLSSYDKAKPTRR